MISKGFVVRLTDRSGRKATVAGVYGSVVAALQAKALEMLLTPPLIEPVEVMGPAQPYRD